jgi:hypothetical protein
MVERVKRSQVSGEEQEKEREMCVRVRMRRVASCFPMSLALPPR